MNNKHYKILNSIFSNPIPADIKWSDIESLLIALGAEIFEGRGSRVCIILNGNRAVFHRPHPDSNTDRGSVKSVRKFINDSGVLLS